MQTGMGKMCIRDRLPCFFLFLMPSEISGETGGRYLRDLGIDIVFVQQRNIQDGNRGMLSAAEYLDRALDCFPYTDGSGDTALIHTFERNWKTEDQVLHYQFHIRQRVSVPGESDYMREMAVSYTHLDVYKRQKETDVTAYLRRLFLKTEQELIREIMRKRSAGYVDLSLIHI